MRRKRTGTGQVVKFMFVLVLLCLAITVTVGLGQTIWTRGQETTIVRNLPEGEETDVVQEEGEQLPEELVVLLEKNPDAEEFVLNYLKKKDQVYEIDLTEQLNSETVPLFFQWDERWGYTTYGSNVMGLTGCGPTCLSMVLLHLLQDATYTPRYVADFAEANGYYVDGSGSAWKLISEGGENLGLEVTELPLDEKRMKKSLELGELIICIMGPGEFTTTGHYIVLCGCKDGKFVVNDPNSKRNSEKLWGYDEMQGQIKNLWACKRK